MRPEMERPRRRRAHRTDWMALLSGMIFIAAGVVLIDRPSVEPLIMLPAVLAGLGLAGLVAILARLIRR
ncbi:hypothetical protein ACWDTT_08605 [Streptosporangium sandarakinum]|uniref:Fatty acid desaturase n=1 Tax=Streptosporangium sandarakinum TaxID=1260955 RepID=A0A852UUU8_9ACTN|nr:hypothetical protein [Streptosporangium sandarakinum]NYF40019.1 fatty acid desaturase [Streptosporangium sandarakinum]